MLRWVKITRSVKYHSLCYWAKHHSTVCRDIFRNITFKNIWGPSYAHVLFSNPVNQPTCLVLVMPALYKVA